MALPDPSTNHRNTISRFSANADTTLCQLSHEGLETELGYGAAIVSPDRTARLLQQLDPVIGRPWQPDASVVCGEVAGDSGFDARGSTTKRSRNECFHLEARVMPREARIEHGGRARRGLGSLSPLMGWRSRRQ